MSERIYGAVDGEFTRRMRNWARARAGLLRDLGIAFTSAYQGFRHDRNPEAVMPVMQGDAQDVTQCLQQLPARYRQAVELFWDNEGASLRRLARKCEPRPARQGGNDRAFMERMAVMSGKQGVNHETFEAWVMRGHELLVPLMAEHRARCRARQASLKAAGAGA